MMFRKFALIGSLLAFGCFGARADDPRAEAVAPFLDADVMMICRINVKTLDVEKLAGRLVEDQASAAMLTGRIAPWLSALRKAGASDLYLLAGPSNVPPAGTSPPSAVVTLAPGADADAVGKLLCGGGEVPPPCAWPTCAKVHGAVFAGSNEQVERLGALKPSAHPELAEAFAAVEGSAAEIVAAPSADARRVFEEMIPNLPAEVGGGPVTTLTRGVRWAALALSDQPEPALRFVLRARDADAAQAVGRLGRNVDQLLRASPAVKAFVADFGKLSDQFKTQIEGDRVTVSADAHAASEWASAVLKPLRQKFTRADCVRNLLMIGLAMHNYHSKHNAFPAAYIADKAGKPLLSWRVLVLPFLDQQALYDEFHLDEPWDGPHNKPLIDRMPAVYACPSELGKKLEPGKTTYLTPRGPRTIFPGAAGVKIKQITDGTSNTIMILDVPADHAVIWTKPDDYEVPAQADPKTLMDTKSLLGRHLGGSNVSFADGSVRFLKQSISPLIFHALTPLDGGEVIGSVSF
jgi:prepilin-type processing-associated H-X9-DG protein